MEVSSRTCARVAVTAFVAGVVVGWTSRTFFKRKAEDVLKWLKG